MCAHCFEFDEFYSESDVLFSRAFIFSSDSKQEMDITAALDEMKSMRARRAGVGTAEMLEVLNKPREEEEKDLAEEDEAILRSLVFQNSSNWVRRVDDDGFDEDYFFEELQKQERKRKGEPLERTVGEEKKGRLPKTKASPVEAPFAVKPKPVTFSIKPKASSRTAAAEGKAKVEGSTGNIIHDVVSKTETVDNVNGKAGIPGSGLSALGLAYDSDSG